MDNFEETTPEEINEGQPEQDGVEMLVVTEDIRSYIYETAKWARFLAIVGFVLTGWVIILAFSASAFVNALNEVSPGSPLAALGSTVMTVVLLMSALVYFYPSLMLFKYATAAKTAVLFAEQESLVIAMSKMKSFFKFWGILTIVGLAFYMILILFAVVANMGAAAV